MISINFTQSSYNPDATLDPGVYPATVSEFRWVYDTTDGTDYIEVQWDVKGFTITEKLKINSPKEKTQGFFQWKLRQLVAALGLPSIPEKKPGEDVNCEISVIGRSCSVEIEHFVTDRGNSIATIKRYMASPAPRQYPDPQIHEPQKPAPMGEIEDDAIPF